MKNKVLPVFVILCLPVLLLSQEKSLTYMNGFSYADTILYGDTSWDHMDQINLLTGIIISRPLEEKPRFRNRIRMAFNHPIWARVSQLDGETNVVQLPDASVRYGANFFAGLEVPLSWDDSLFSSTAFVGPVLDFQSLTDSMMFNLGIEGGIDGQFGLSESWSFVMGLSLFYNYWGVHTVGDAAKYETYIKRGMGIMLSPGFRFSY